MNTRSNLRSSGGTSIVGGEYASVRVSGALKVSETLDCEELNASGSVKVTGDLRCSGRIAASGAVKVDGSLTSGSISTSGALACGSDLTVQGALHSSGSLTCSGRLTAETLKTTGVAKCTGNVHVRELQTSGHLAAGAGVEAEHFRSSGKVEITGLLNAEEVVIDLSTACTIGDIGGSSIVVQRTRRGFSLTAPSLSARSIEGDTIQLEYTKAAVVRGRSVRIGEGCEIGRVEYTGDLTITDGTVLEQVKL